MTTAPSPETLVGHHRLPDIRLRRAEGGEVSPTDFVGHELIVLFPPADDRAARQELEDYCRRCPEFDKLDAWLLAVFDRHDAPTSDAISVVYDVDGAAWRALTECAGEQALLSQDKGAAFVFSRGGSLQKVLGGAGRSAEVLEELRKRR